jgi:hypothetical protein
LETVVADTIQAPRPKETIDGPACRAELTRVGIAESLAGERRCDLELSGEPCASLGTHFRAWQRPSNGSSPRGRTSFRSSAARTRAQLEESLGALDVQFSPADLALIEEAIPPSAVAGTRYGEQHVQILDSER